DLKWTVTINGSVLADSDVLYAGVTPGLAGLDQVNARVPEFLPDGDLSVVVKIGSFVTPAGAFLSLKHARPDSSGDPNTVAAIQLTAPANTLLSARTMTVAARAYTVFGAVVA